MKAVRFVYNGRPYMASNFEKKLKKLGITAEQVEIIPDVAEPEEMREDAHYYFRRGEEMITSIYPTLDHLSSVLGDITEWERVV